MNKEEFENSMEWHDGILKDVKIECGESVSIKIFFDFYRGDAQEREQMAGDFYQVDDISIFIDSGELRRHKFAGNISNGYINKIKRTKKYKFFLYLSDGFVSFTFRDFNINSINC